MAAITGAFSMYYKRLQSGSLVVNEPWLGNLVQTWWDVNSTNISSSFLNFPRDTLTTTYLTTRDSGSNEFYRAFPWGSAACDFLWNCTVPSWSYEDSSSVVQDWQQPGSNPDVTIVDRYWKVNMYTSRSFYRDNLRGVSSVGVASYPITSSWTAVDAKFFATAVDTGYSGAVFRYLHSTASQPIYPTFIGSQYNVPEPDRSDEIAYDITWPTTTGNALSALDNRYFDIGTGIGITRPAVSASLVTMSISQSATSGNSLKDFRTALKQRRLFCPVPVSGSGTNQGTDYWFKLNTSYNSSELFDTNGGIYNVQFTLKRLQDNADYYPDLNTFMTVFIHDVQTEAPLPSERVAGAAGWYPPDNNIVVIGNNYGLAPQMTFNEPQSGHRIEQFNFNVIQYGYPAQLCIEVSGSLANDKYFGIIVDDIKICKIGVTTDPRFIKPTTIGTVVQTSGGGFIPPVYQLPGEDS